LRAFSDLTCALPWAELVRRRLLRPLVRSTPAFVLVATPLALAEALEEARTQTLAPQTGDNGVERGGAWLRRELRLAAQAGARLAVCLPPGAVGLDAAAACALRELMATSRGDQTSVEFPVLHVGMPGWERALHAWALRGTAVKSVLNGCATVHPTVADSLQRATALLEQPLPRAPCAALCDDLLTRAVALASFEHLACDESTASALLAALDARVFLAGLCLNNTALLPRWSSSAQGFVALALLHSTRPRDGALTELLRLHLWDQDAPSRAAALKVHSHSLGARSWVLHGGLCDQQFDAAPAAGHLDEEACSVFSLRWDGSTTHTLSQAVSSLHDTGRRVVLCPRAATRITCGGTYAVLAGVPHRTLPLLPLPFTSGRDTNCGAVEATTMFFFSHVLGVADEGLVLGKAQPREALMHVRCAGLDSFCVQRLLEDRLHTLGLRFGGALQDIEQQCAVSKL
jgi:hypothetical protein